MLYKRAYLDHSGHFDDDFSKLFVILQIAREEDLTTLEFWALVSPGMILKQFSLNPYHLQPLYSSNGKNFT